MKKFLQGVFLLFSFYEVQKTSTLLLLEQYSNTMHFLKGQFKTERKKTTNISGITSIFVPRSVYGIGLLLFV